MCETQQVAKLWWEPNKKALYLAKLWRCDCKYCSFVATASAKISFADGITKPEEGERGTSQLDGCRWVQRWKHGGWSLICVRRGDILSSLIIVWILFIPSNTFSRQQTAQTRDLTLQIEAWEEKIENSNLVWRRTNGEETEDRPLSGDKPS